MDGSQARMARAALKMSVRDLAAAAKVSPNTVTRVEAGLPVNNSTVAAIRAALEAAGVIFIDANGGGPGVRLGKSSAGGSIPPDDLNASNDE
jgi:transcriptional regulator with XRE-family HTH domain